VYTYTETEIRIAQCHYHYEEVWRIAHRILSVGRCSLASMFDLGELAAVDPHADEAPR
jgi:hypothetical protein